MHLRGSQRSPSRFEDFRLTAAVGLILGAYAGFAFGLYWLMQPAVATNHGLAAYRPPPNAVVRDADSPWVPPPPSEAPPLPAAAKPAPEVAKSVVAEQPKKEVRKQETRAAPRRERPVREQPNPFSGYASSPSYGPRRWF